jgi:hypothetical protein
MSATFDTVRKIALSLERVEEGTSYGTPAFRVNGALFLRLHQDGESLVVRTDFEQRKELLEADPAVYYITDHYLNYEWILVRLARVHGDALRDIVRMAYKFAVAEKRRAPRGRRATS